MKRILIAGAVYLLFSLSLRAQDPVTGFPPYGSFDQGGFDAVNLQNLNVHFAPPVVVSPARGLNFSFALTYDSLVWKQVTSGSTTVWTPVLDNNGVAAFGWRKDAPMGAITWTVTTHSTTCPRDGGGTYQGTLTIWSNYVYTDSAGTRHAFGVNSTEACDMGGGTTTGYATDGSGFYVDIGGADQPLVYSSNGTLLTTSNKVTDANGNFYSGSVVGSVTTWKDSANRNALVIDKTNSAYIDYKVFDTAGQTQTYRLTFNASPVSIKTNFQCTNIGEYTNTASLPVSLTLPNGKTYLFEYEDTPQNSSFKTGRLSKVTLPTGGYVQYAYPAANPTTDHNGINCTDSTITNLTRTINDGSASVNWQYDRALNAGVWSTTITAPQLSYDSAANQTVLAFNSTGQETSRKIYQGPATGSAKRTINTTWSGYAPATRVTVLEDNQQSKVAFTYDTYNNVTQVSEYNLGAGAPGSVARTTNITYLATAAYLARNIVNLPTQVTIKDSAGTVKSRTDIAYDESGYINTSCPTGIPQHDDTGYSCTYAYRGNTTTVTKYTAPATPSGAITKHFYYDWFGNLRQAGLNCCQQKTWNYSATTQYAFPDSVVSGSSSPQLTTSATYSAYTGQVLTSTDENGKVTSFTYSDPGHMNRLTDIARPDGKHVTYTYDDTNRKVTVTSPVSGTNVVKQTSFFDPLGRSIKQQVTDAGGASYSIAEAQYDVYGRPYKSSNLHNSTAQYWTETDFDALGRPTVTIPPGGTATSNSTLFSYAGATVTVTDPAGKARKTQSDGLGRMINVFEPDVAQSNSLTQQTSYTYNVLDQLTQVSQGSQTRTYVYDGLGRLTDATTPESGHFVYQYNSYNLVTQRTDARTVLTTYAYDTLNRLTSTSYNVGSTGVPATSSVTFTYGTSSASNNNGRLITLTDGVGSENYTYDILGRVTQLQKVIASTTYTTAYGYNDASELASMTYPSSRVVQQNFDAIGRLCSVGASGSGCSSGTNYASGFGYNPAGQVTGFNYGNSVAAAFAYTQDRLLLQTLSYTKTATTLLSMNYYYSQDATNCPAAPTGNNGQIQCIKDTTGTQEAGRSVTYTYDALYRLKTASTAGSTSYPQWGLSWTYDRYGNRTAQSVTAGTGVPQNSVTVSATTNRITGSPYAYDANGNMTNDGANTLTYDAENHAVTAAGTMYVYDGNGLRVRKCAPNCTSPTSRTVYIFSGSKVITEYDNGAAPGSPTREYAYTGGALLAKFEAGATSYFHPDHLSNRVITDSAGIAAGTRGHYPYGENWYESGTTTKLKFTTYERDAESGNDFALARYHVNRLGRFSSADPLAGSTGDPQSLNRYPYVQGDTINAADPSGLCREIPFHDSWECGPQDDPFGWPFNGFGSIMCPGWQDPMAGYIFNSGRGCLAGTEAPFDAAWLAMKVGANTVADPENLNGKKCVEDLAKLDVTGDQIRAGAAAANFLNGVGSTVPMSSLYATSPHAGVRQAGRSAKGTVGDNLAGPGTVAVSQLGGPDIYVNPAMIDPRNYLSNLGTAFHEIVHNVSGLTDPDIQRALGIKEQAVTHNITEKLLKDCF